MQGPPLLFESIEIASFSTGPAVLGCHIALGMTSFGSQQTTMIGLGFHTGVGCWVYAHLCGGGGGG